MPYLGLFIQLFCVNMVSVLEGVEEGGRGQARRAGLGALISLEAF